MSGDQDAGSCGTRDTVQGETTSNEKAERRVKKVWVATALGTVMIKCEEHGTVYDEMIKNGGQVPNGVIQNILNDQEVMYSDIVELGNRIEILSELVASIEQRT